jgi:PhzF family phenazine biosynthesis protein
MPYPYTIVDAFTDTPFAGNPAAVYILEAARSTEWMQLVAREMNVSETAFVVPEGERYQLRWFTPIVEVPLCGHATLASAHVLYTPRRLARHQTALFETRSGELEATAEADGIALDFPLRRPWPVDAPPALEAALGMAPVEVWKHGDNLLALLPSSNDVRQLSPNMTAIKALPTLGVIVTAVGNETGTDFVSRYFAPAKGINEDPVTGAAHCMLAPFWAERLHTSEMTGYQASARGGIVRVRLQGDRVRLLGHAVTIAQGELVVEALGQQQRFTI